VPAIIINGTADPIVPWDGGPVRVGKNKFGDVVSVAETVAFWVRHNGAEAESEREWLPKAHDGDETRAWREHHRAGNTGADVVLCGVEGGGHTWPGGEQYLAEWIIGKTNGDFDASEVIWEFFKKWARTTA
jgi:polyhydroxybutyrate depolymerase